jgi:Histidine kinase-like ATPase domain
MSFSPMSGRVGTVGGTAGAATPSVPEHGSGVGPAFQGTEGPPVSTSSRWPLWSYLELGALSSAVPCARLHARQVVWEWGLEALTEAIELIVSELVTNGVRASVGVTRTRYKDRWTTGVPPVRLWICSDRTNVLVQVWDGSDRKPVRQDVAADAVGGRGLLLVEALSADWGTYTPEGSTGKVVWALAGTR